MNNSGIKTVKTEKMVFHNFLSELGVEQVRQEILEGLLAESKYISSKYFYDKTGSELFEEITKLSEYYPTRTEKQILRKLSLVFIKSYEGLNIVEIGSGDHSKISLLLRKIPAHFVSQITYIPVDISAAAIAQSGNALLNSYPELKIEGIVADFLKQLNCIPNRSNRLICFLGSTIGNLTPEQTDEFMLKMAGVMNKGEFFLVGFDNIKDIETLEKAYNDTQGITAKFNLNILNVVNEQIATNFNTSDFRHVAFYNPPLNRIEMHIEALKEVEISSKYLTSSLKINKGERIHTENSYKFNKELISIIANKNGFGVQTIFTDERNWFSLALLEKY